MADIILRGLAPLEGMQTVNDETYSKFVKILMTAFVNMSLIIFIVNWDFGTTSNYQVAG